MVLRKKAVGTFSEDVFQSSESEEFSVGDKTFKVKRAVTLPAWKFDEGETKVFKILDKIHQSERLSSDEVPGKGKSKETMREPAKISHVRDLIGGSLYTLIYGAGLYRDLTDNYPDDSYVGKSFRVTKLKAKKSSKGFTFFPYSVSEIESA